MGKPAAKREIKQDRAVKTRQDILQAAIQLFATRGILATTMAELARAIKMTPGALYWHFPTKEDLLLSAIEELHSRFMVEFTELITEGRKWTAKKQLATFVERTHNFLRYHREHGIFFGMLSAEAADNNARVGQALRDALSTYVFALSGILRYGQLKTKEFRADVDPNTLAQAILFSNIGLITQQNLFRESLSYDPLVGALHAVILDGVELRPARPA
jgi:AcrR family transcriptional regulator